MLPDLTALSLAPLAAALALLTLLTPAEGPLRAAGKGASTLALALLAALNAAPLLALALVAAALGDIALAFRGSRPFLAGMAAFGLAHIGFIALFAGAGADPAILAIPVRAFAAIALVALALWLGRAFARQAGPLCLPVIGYVAIIAAMGLAALALPPMPALPLILAGAALFVLSDALIGQQTFLDRRWTGQGVAIWLTYHAALQALTLGLLAV
ncbi:lysoplasmalogenase family protein [Pseudaestuariivita atlantica]|uniref:Lysoplasmalogenase n=1 Tax=Pseudaestuariivita atlantica TaxID=1317121 RepID=A0A0L1JUY6_9RHOB|nr:lysoplasmalogenase family protein [Pseudaestuariivita atlantica]KNG95581.1 hypothetical protein ATO11_03065 [Pseudaestuariivita atlantica]